VIRHDLYMDIQAKLKQKRTERLTTEEFDELYEKIFEKFEKIRTECYSIIMQDDNIEEDKAKWYMQKAYVTYATVSSLSRNASQEARKAHWPKLVMQVSTEHGKIITAMKSGKFPENIDKDPRLSALADDKIDLKSLPQYKGGFSSQKTMLPDKDVRVKRASAKVDKYVDKMILLAKAARQRVADRKASEASKPVAATETVKAAPATETETETAAASEAKQGPTPSETTDV